MNENGADRAGSGDGADAAGSATDPLADEDLYRVLGPDGTPLPDATVPDLSDDQFRAIDRALSDRDIDVDRVRRESKSDWESERDDDYL